MSIITALVPAAGRGLRMGGTRKQYRMLDGEPLLVRTLRLFDVHPGVAHLVVSVPAADVSSLSDSFVKYGIRKIYAVVAGGSNRQESVAAALESAPGETDIVLVHDAVRPFVSRDRIDAVIEAASREGAAALAVPVSDTLRRVKEGRFGETLDRSGIYRMQTPQAFRRDWFVQAHRAARSAGWSETDDVALVQKTGRSVAIVHGSSYNIKVTSSDDWALAEALSTFQTQARPGKACE